LFGKTLAMPDRFIMDRRNACLGLCSSLAAALAAAPARAASWAEGENGLRIVVMKSRRKLMLMRAGVAFRSFPIALGNNPKGPKRMQGDGRTPEGRYAIDAFNPQSLYHRALHISYPNTRDLALARAAGLEPGSNIEIHGMPAGYGEIDPTAFDTDWTDGCIGVSNRAIETIWKTVSLDTPVTILA
jgi:murein L,D-transpeptidase YafK